MCVSYIDERGICVPGVCVQCWIEGAHPCTSRELENNIGPFSRIPYPGAVDCLEDLVLVTNRLVEAEATPCGWEVAVLTTREQVALPKNVPTRDGYHLLYGPDSHHGQMILNSNNVCPFDLRGHHAHLNTHSTYEKVDLRKTYNM